MSKMNMESQSGWQSNTYLLERKFENDLKNAVAWSQFSLSASVIGVALIIAGGVGVLIIGVTTGPAAGSIVGGVTALSGILINILTHLVFNPAGRATAQLNDTGRILLEEMRVMNALQIAGSMDAQEKNTYRKLIISKYLGLLELPSEEKPGKNSKK